MAWYEKKHGEASAWPNFTDSKRKLLPLIKTRVTQMRAFRRKMSCSCLAYIHVVSRLFHKDLRLMASPVTAKNTAEGESDFFLQSLVCFKKDCVSPPIVRTPALLKKHGPTMTANLFDLQDELRDVVSSRFVLDSHPPDVCRVFPFRDVSLLPWNDFRTCENFGLFRRLT